jgi:hypothetical protein
MCPKCKSRHWHEPKRNEQGRRTDLESTVGKKEDEE